ncbi:GAF and ANTAR domain-containing protein [Streptomyces sp. DH24]|uniref:GAF and ANTAR domain-containing protein n=1 Tax=Streptomyces sp. DH24 TaxID=3040123 RepID=UPI0024411586|nr:GAF and ANTAR domain-containing protein [Streptomyces sp. DH24]MDG9718495.1 GAF and ANTAR domain-containing protein [Streptomyces sp. DH24]
MDQDRARAADLIASTLRGAAPEQVPERLCAVAVALLPVSGASVSLRGGGMPAQLSASSPRAAHLADVQATLGDGPCQWVLETGAPVFVRDLVAGGDADRWPVFAQAATAAGVRAVYALPLGFGDVCVGTLDLYRESPGELTDRQRRTAEIVAGAMTVALMALPHGEEQEAEGAHWLHGLASDHDAVHHAVGMIMAQLGMGAEDALARLRGDAFAQGRTALDVARDVVARRRRFEPD